MNRWSQSALNTLEWCGERFRRQYMDRERVPQTLRMARGSAVHFVAAEAHKRQMEDRGEWEGEPSAFSSPPGTRSATGEAQDLAASEFDRLERSGLAYAPSDVKEGVRAATGKQKDVAVALAARYVERVAPGIYPKAVERRVEVRPPDSDVVVSGVMDLVELLPSGGEAIVDEKATEVRPNVNAARDSRQLTMYALLRSAETGQLPERTSLIHLVHQRGSVSVVRQDSRRTQGDLAALVGRLNRGIAAVEKGVFMPNTSWWGCSPKWCPFFDTCPFPEGRDREDEE